MADVSMDPSSESSMAIPPLYKSNAIIKKQAKNALQTLKEMNAEDLIDILGLRSYCSKPRKKT